MTSGYDFGQLYGAADHSGGYLYDKGVYDAVVEKSVYGRTKDGQKGSWTITFRTSTGQGAGMRGIPMTLSISPMKNDGSPNQAGLGIMFRQLGAMGVPVPNPENPQEIINGRFPFWLDQNTGQPLPRGHAEEIAAQIMTGKACQIGLDQEEWEGVTRNKVKQILPARPGAPTTWPQPQVQQNPMAQQGFAPWGQQAPQPAAPYGPQGYAQPAAPGYPPQQPQGPQQPAWGQQPGVPAQPVYPPGPTQYPPMQQPAPPVPGAPPWAQPGQPGQGGMGEFTQGGQSYQPSHMDPSQMQQPPAQAPYQQPQPPAGPQPGYDTPPWQGQPQQAPAQPPWQQPQQQAPQGYPPQAQQQPYPPQQPPQQGPGAAPPQPPWAQ